MDAGIVPWRGRPSTPSVEASEAWRFERRQGNGGSFDSFRAFNNVSLVERMP